MTSSTNAAARDWEREAKALRASVCRKGHDAHRGEYFLRNECVACLADFAAAAYEAGRADAAPAPQCYCGDSSSAVPCPCCGARSGEPCRHEVRHG